MHKVYASMIFVAICTIKGNCILLNRWQILDQTECSSRCGEGYIIRRIKCVKRSQTGNDYMDDKHCTDMGPKPDVRISCHGMCLATHWAYTEWSEVRLFTCVNEEK